jgi:hypothetical protein
MLSVETICRPGITPTYPRNTVLGGFCDDGFGCLADWVLGVAGYQIALDLSSGLHDIFDSALSFDPSA